MQFGFFLKYFLFQERQVLLAFYERAHPHDAGLQGRHQGVHLQVTRYIFRFAPKQLS